MHFTAISSSCICPLNGEKQNFGNEQKKTSGEHAFPFFASKHGSYHFKAGF